MATSRTQAMTDSDLSLGQGMSADTSLNQVLYPKYVTNPLDDPGFTPFGGFQNGGPSSLGSEDPHSFDLFEPCPEIPFSEQPLKAVEDIYNSFPSVARIFPTWPFSIVEQPKSCLFIRDWYEEYRIKESRGHGKELSVERVYAPGTPAHRLLNSSSQQSVREFIAEYEIFTRKLLSPTPEDVPRIVQPTPCIFGTGTYDSEQHNPQQQVPLFQESRAPNPLYRCSICYFRPSHDSIPNWLYYTKDNDTAPRYYYCANCKAGDQWVELKSLASLTGMVDEIVAICRAEDEAKKLGMEGVITSVPLAKFLRYEIMFEVELQAASVRKAIEAEKKKTSEEEERRLLEMRQEMMSGLNLSYFGNTAAKAIADRLFTNLEQKLFNTLGPLPYLSMKSSPFHLHYEQANSTIQEREDTEQTTRPITPEFPEDYLSSQAIVTCIENIDEIQTEGSHTPPGRPSTPVWFTGQSKNSSPSSSARSSATFVEENALFHFNDQYSQTAFESFSKITGVDDDNGDFIYSDENMDPGPMPGPSRAPCYQEPIRSGVYLLKTDHADYTDHYKNNCDDYGSPIIVSEDESGADFESDTSDMSEWDSDDSLEDSPRRLKCLDMLDQFIPPALIASSNQVKPTPPPRVLRLSREERLRYRRLYGVIPAVTGDLATIGEASDEEREEPIISNKGKGRALDM